MPYFQKHNALFIHIPKNAGSFIESSLGIPDSWGLQIAPGKPRRMDKFINYLKPIKRKIYNSDLLKTQQAFHLFGPIAGQYLLQHATLSEILSLGLLDPDNIANTFCFCIKRHPVARAISIYKYWKFDNKYSSFEEFCEDIVLLSSRSRNLHLAHQIRTHLRSQIDFMKLPNGSIPPWLSIIDINDLAEFWNNQVDNCGWPSLNAASQISRNQTVKSGDLAELVTPRCLEIIHETYSDDFTCLGYALNFEMSR